MQFWEKQIPTFTQLQLETLERVKKTLTGNGLKKTNVLKSYSVDTFLVDLIGGDDPSIFVHSRVEAEKWFGKDPDLIIWEDALSTKNHSSRSINLQQKEFAF